MFIILAYAPLLLCLPLLLVLGLVFVVVPGGFIVVLVGLSYVAFAGLSFVLAEISSFIGLAVSRRRQGRTQARRATTSSRNVSPAGNPPFVPPGVPIPLTVGFTENRAIEPSSKLTMSGRRAGDLDRIRALDARRAADRQERTAA